MILCSTCENILDIHVYLFINTQRKVGMKIISDNVHNLF